jgi:hypothetical protein
MYRTCLFCAHDLGANESIEHFPIGRRLAFDAAKGRLWVVCRACARWNLTPLEDRWEAIEECERAYRATRLRVATDNVGLARLAEGTELVRIGQPLRPELAAWRYGDQFGRRRRRAIVTGSVLGTAAAGALVALPIAGASAGALAGVLAYAGYLATMVSGVTGGKFIIRRPRWIEDTEGQHLLVGSTDIVNTRLVAAPEGQGGWGLVVPYQRRSPTRQFRWNDARNGIALEQSLLTGPAALRAAQALFPLVNGQGGAPQVVRDSVGFLEQHGAGEGAFRAAAANVRAYAERQTFGDSGALAFLPREVRLALEMAAHEDLERRAMEGELALLEAAWKDAEEVAAIADDLLLPAGLPGMLARLRQRARAQ